MAIIELRNLSKWYGEVIGLNNVTVSVNHGITGLLGPNGAGKTTFMAIATGQIRPCIGSMLVLGQRPWDNPNVLSRIGYCPEGDAYWPNVTGREFVRLCARLSGLGLRSARCATEHAIDRVGLTSASTRAVRTYSKGMRQRIKIAQALVHNPELLILDEPFIGADPVARHDMADLLCQLADDGMDILISSHILHEVEALTKQIIMIDHGRVVAEGNVRAVRSSLRNRPHTIRIRADKARIMAQALIRINEVVGLGLPDSNSLVVQTRDPQLIYKKVLEASLEHNVVLREMASADDNLEAVFGYLTNRGS